MRLVGEAKRLMGGALRLVGGAMRLASGTVSHLNCSSIKGWFVTYNL